MSYSLNLSTRAELVRLVAYLTRFGGEFIESVQLTVTEPFVARFEQLTDRDAVLSSQAPVSPPRMPRKTRKWQDQKNLWRGL
jgi:hypothetical protein